MAKTWTALMEEVQKAGLNSAEVMKSNDDVLAMISAKRQELEVSHGTLPAITAVQTLFNMFSNAGNMVCKMVAATGGTSSWLSAASGVLSVVEYKQPAVAARLVLLSNTVKVTEQCLGSMDVKFRSMEAAASTKQMKNFFKSFQVWGQLAVDGHEACSGASDLRSLTATLVATSTITPPPWIMVDKEVEDGHAAAAPPAVATAAQPILAGTAPPVLAASISPVSAPHLAADDDAFTLTADDDPPISNWMQRTRLAPLPLFTPSLSFAAGSSSLVSLSDMPLVTSPSSGPKTPPSVIARPLPQALTVPVHRDSMEVEEDKRDLEAAEMRLQMREMDDYSPGKTLRDYELIFASIGLAPAVPMPVQAGPVGRDLLETLTILHALARDSDPMASEEEASDNIALEMNDFILKLLNEEAAEPQGEQQAGAATTQKQPEVANAGRAGHAAPSLPNQHSMLGPALPCPESSQ